MYPTMSNNHFKTAVQNALKAANIRVKERIKRSNSVKRVVRRNSLDEYFDQDWTPEDNEDENGVGDLGDSEHADGDPPREIEDSRE